MFERIADGSGGCRSSGLTSVRELIGEADPATTLFWSGAGISAEPPTCAPIGFRLADRALGHAFLPETAGILASYYRRLRLARSRPRLETLLDVATRIHGEVVLDDLLSDLRAPPNALHRFFAEHLLRGGGHITANFDNCIEQAAGTGHAVSVLHFHGSLGSGELGATLGRIERGFPPEVRTAATEALLSDSQRLIVFVGYSGSDFFDVDPFLRSLEPGALRGRRVLWIGHSNGPLTVVPATRRQLASLAAAGASVTEVSAPSRDILKVLASSWRIPLGQPHGSRPEWHPTVTLDDEARRRATLELYALMSLHREVNRVADREHPRELELLAHTRWAEGRYRAAGAIWSGTRQGASRTERTAAVWWVRGQYWRARRLLVAALKTASGSLEDRLLLAETLARVLDHMQRYPDSRFFVTERLRQFSLDHLSDPEELARVGSPLGTHLYARVRSARALLEITAAQNEDASTSFGEYEALGAQLNYQHARLRERARHARVERIEYQLHCRDFETIGAFGDAARATLLGGPAAFSWSELWNAIRRLDVTRWHRLRLLGAALTNTWGTARR